MSGHRVPGTRVRLYNDDDTLFLTSSVAHLHMLTCISRIVRITCVDNRQRLLKLPLTLAPPRAHSKPTHPLGHRLRIGINCIVHVQQNLCAWQAQACVTVRHVRAGAAGDAGGAGDAGAALTTNSLRHMLDAVFKRRPPAESSERELFTAVARSK